MLLSEAAPNDPPGSDSLALLCRDEWDKPSSLNLKYYFTPHQEYPEATGKGRAGRAGQTGRCLCDFTMVPSAPGG